MNILLIHQYFLEAGAGGGSRFNELTKIWEREGNKITVLAGMVNYATGKKADEYKGKFVAFEKLTERLTVIRCHVSEAYNVSFLGRLWAYFSFVFSSIYAGIFSLKFKPDIILISSPPLFVGITGFILSKIKRVPFVFEVRDLWPESAIDTGVLTSKHLIKLSYFFERFIYKKAKKINVVTPAFKKILINNKGIDPSKLLLIPNAADFSLVENISPDFYREQFRAKYNFGDNLVIIYVGAHGVANGLHLLVETAELVQHENVLFISIGAGMKRQELVEMVENKGLRNIRFLDPVPKSEVFKYILASDIGTSVLLKNDTFKTIYSNKTFDYMSCKKPILMAIDGVSRELVEVAKCGLYIEPENAKDFSDKIKFYLKNYYLILEHGQNGYKFAKENFDREILALKYLEELKSVIKIV